MPRSTHIFLTIMILLLATASVAAPAVKAGALAQGTQALGEGMAPKAGGKIYRHAIGFTFWHPGDWTVKEEEEMLQLIPPNPSTTASGDPTEIYLIIGDNTAGDEGITGADDPRVAQLMDQAVAQLAPFLQRSTAPAAMVTAAGHKGVVMNWQGKSPSGDFVCARAYISVIKDSGISLVALCLRDRLQARETELRRIFTSFAFGEGQRDSQLAGAWNFLETSSLTNWSPFQTAYSRAQIASDTTGTLVMRPDGTWTRMYKTQMIAGAGGVWLESTDTKESKGTWYAGNGSLHLIWDDKSWQEYKYEIRQTPQGLRLLLASGGKGELWERAK